MEFTIIQRYFSSQGLLRKDVLLGIGDDAAITSIPEGKTLVYCVDNFVEGIHFLVNTPPKAIAYKSLAVNLSDLAAMGAEAAWTSLALTFNTANDHFLSEFSQGFFDCANHFNVQLIGGDLSAGPFNVSVSAFGFIDAKKALRRDTAKVGDRIFVSGDLGSAICGLNLLRSGVVYNELDEPQRLCIDKLYYPEPKLQLGQSLLGIANAAIDISDGLYGDLGHILQSSQMGAAVSINKLPIADCAKASNPDAQQLLQDALTAGDEYELCFTVPEDKLDALQSVCETNAYSVTEIGIITSAKEFKLIGEDGRKYEIKQSSHEHFKTT